MELTYGELELIERVLSTHETDDPAVEVLREKIAAELQNRTFDRL